MKKAHFFWGSFFVFLGIFLIFDQYNIYNINSYSVFKFWPLILVLWGISLFKLGNWFSKLISVSFGFVTALFLFALFNFNSWDYDCDEHESKKSKKHYKKHIVKYDYEDKINYAFLEADLGACSFELRDNKKYLAISKSNLPAHNISLTNEQIDSVSVQLDLDMKLKKKSWRFNEANYIELDLNTNPIWNMNFDIGAIDFCCDMSNLKVSHFEMDAGAANIELVFGDLLDSVDIELEVGASNIEISIPKDSGCKVYSKTGLSNEDFYGFIEKHNYYITENFDEADNKIIINIDGGISNFEIVRN